MLDCTMESECIWWEILLAKKRNTFDFLPLSSGSRKDRMLRLTSAMLRPNSRYEMSPGNTSDDRLMILWKIYCVCDNPDHPISSIRTLLSHARNLQAVPVPQVSLGKASSFITNTRETHKHRERSRRTFYIPPRLDPCLFCPRTPATPSTITWPGWPSEQVYVNFVSCLFFPTKYF